MPVYLLTTHAYRSWDEGNPKGYVQHGEGVQAPSAALARWRSEHASQEPTRFDRDDQLELLGVTSELATEYALTLHAGSATCTHVHQLISFRQPDCSCDAVGGCVLTCLARRHCEAFITRFKRVAGCRLAKRNAVRGRKWFSHKWDVARVADRNHFDYLIETYLPKHADEGGVVRIFKP